MSFGLLLEWLHGGSLPEKIWQCGKRLLSLIHAMAIRIKYDVADFHLAFQLGYIHNTKCMPILSIEISGKFGTERGL